MQKYSPRKGFTLMPAVALSTLAAIVAIPVLSSSYLHAASPEHVASMTVRTGDSLWAIAERATPEGGNVPDTVDAIVAANHLGTSALIPGMRLKVPAP